MRTLVWRAGLVILALSVPGASGAATPLTWPDTPAARTAAAARLDSLQQLLMRQPSATLVLGQWCAAYHLAPEAHIVAQRVRGAPKPAPASVRQNLALKPGEPVGYRRVQLLCGDRILSDADNWYVPDRLTPAMNRLLDQTDTPFGLAVRSLHFRRQTLSSERLWSPPAALSAGGMMPIPDHLLRNEGLLTVAGGVPISQVIESYTAAVLGAAPP
jgi:chorismate-pyruvate lyase